MKKIMIVDDQAFIRTVLKSHLDKLGSITTIEAANGNEALGKAKVTLPDLILMDIVMPNKDGIDAIAELKQHPTTQHIPVVVISSHADDETKNRAIAAGAAEFIDKINLPTIDVSALVHKYVGQEL